MNDRFQTRTTEIEAIEWLGVDSWEIVQAFVGAANARRIKVDSVTGVMSVPDTRRGMVPCPPGAWLARIDDEFRVIPAVKFRAEYEPCGEPVKPGRVKPEKLEPDREKP